MTGAETYLFLENGHLFVGAGFGSSQTGAGEAVFNTGMTGYQEIFTDPSYYKQVVVMTQPHLGNTAINWDDVESRGLFLSGVVAREYCEYPSSWRNQQSLHEYLAKANVPGISDVDTREITSVLRDEGAQRAVIFAAAQAGKTSPADYARSLLQNVEPMEGLELVSRVSCQEPFEFSAGRGPDAGTCVVYDYGVKTNILRSVAQTGFRTVVVPYNLPFQEVMKWNPKAVILSNGPGDPATVTGAVENIQGLVGKVPMLAICMGHQLLARSLGAQTYKLKFGHHGVNHPVKDIESGRILITSQNHGFSVKAEDLRQREIKLSHVSLNDDTVEGFFSEKMKISSVQFHPEAKPGPSDASSVFEQFVRGFLA